jgi:hypothetical protein
VVHGLRSEVTALSAVRSSVETSRNFLTLPNEWAGRFSQLIPKGKTLMTLNLKRGVLILVTALGVGASIIPAVAAPFFQDHDHDQDYSKNKKYQQGMREGQDDRTHNRDHSKKRHFKKDEDQKAYESGYQKGHGG